MTTGRCRRASSSSGETWEEAALREVLEETGVGGRLLGASSTATATRTARDVPSSVRWWLMQPVAIDAREPDDEVDEVRWVPLDEAEALLSFAHDRSLVAGRAMPEGDTIHYAANRIRPILAGRVPRAADAAPRLQGRSLARAPRRPRRSRPSTPTASTCSCASRATSSSTRTCA